MSSPFELKKLHKDAVPAALEKAIQYRLLSEPGHAESICHDVLLLEPENQHALIILILALTDRFGNSGYSVGLTQAREVLPHLLGEYERAYYAGIICERRAKAQLQHANPGYMHDAYEGLREAMDWYEKAEAIRPAGNDDTLLRWNTCVRLIQANKLAPRAEEPVEPALE